MKPKQITQSELATLAAALTAGSAKERVMLAYEIWDEASDPDQVQTDCYEMKITRRDIDLITRDIRHPVEMVLEDLKEEGARDASPKSWEKFRAYQKKKEWIHQSEIEEEKKKGVLVCSEIYEEFLKWEDMESTAKVNKSKKPGGDALWHVAKPKKAFGESKTLTFGELIERNVSVLKMTTPKAREWAGTWISCGDIKKNKAGKYTLRPLRNKGNAQPSTQSKQKNEF